MLIFLIRPINFVSRYPPQDQSRMWGPNSGNLRFMPPPSRHHKPYAFDNQWNGLFIWSLIVLSLVFLIYNESSNIFLSSSNSSILCSTTINYTNFYIKILKRVLKCKKLYKSFRSYNLFVSCLNLVVLFFYNV